MIGGAQHATHAAAVRSGRASSQAPGPSPKRERGRINQSLKYLQPPYLRAEITSEPPASPCDATRSVTWPLWPFLARTIARARPL